MARPDGRADAVSLEPGIATLAAAALVDWENFRKCSAVCQSETGEPCYAMNGRIAGGRPDGVRTPLPRAHSSRKRLEGR